LDDFKTAELGFEMMGGRAVYVRFSLLFALLKSFPPDGLELGILPILNTSGCRQITAPDSIDMRGSVFL
jgi:hypothetical protein